MTFGPCREAKEIEIHNVRAQNVLCAEAEGAAQEMQGSTDRAINRARCAGLI